MLYNMLCCVMFMLYLLYKMQCFVTLYKRLCFVFVTLYNMLCCVMFILRYRTFTVYVMLYNVSSYLMLCYVTLYNMLCCVMFILRYKPCNVCHVI